MREVYIFGIVIVSIFVIGILISFQTLAEDVIINQSTTLMLNMSDNLNIDQYYKDKISASGERHLNLPFDLIFLIIAFVVLGGSMWYSYTTAPTNPIFFATRTFGGLVLGIFFLAIFILHFLEWFYDQILHQIFEFTLTNYPIMNHFYSLWWVYFILFYVANVLVNQFLGNDGVGEQ